MKTYVFTGRGVQTQVYSYGVSLTAQELAEHAKISVKEVEAMTDEQIKSFMQDNMRIINNMVYSGNVDGEIDWPYNPEYNCNRDFDLDVEE